MATSFYRRYGAALCESNDSNDNFECDSGFQLRLRVQAVPTVQAEVNNGFLFTEALLT